MRRICLNVKLPIAPVVAKDTTPAFILPLPNQYEKWRHVGNGSDIDAAPKLTAATTIALTTPTDPAINHCLLSSGVFSRWRQYKQFYYTLKLINFLLTIKHGTEL